MGWVGYGIGFGCSFFWFSDIWICGWGVVGCVVVGDGGSGSFLCGVVCCGGGLG